MPMYLVILNIVRKLGEILYDDNCGKSEKTGFLPSKLPMLLHLLLLILENGGEHLTNGITVKVYL